ncbi:hypothetical protein D5086_003449 [Populus alba]|uniref:Uncharacterized protein n=1 Tax=Populus alba TaxID=43335 RepID=A0ACC4D5W5_POPAL
MVGVPSRDEAMRGQEVYLRERNVQQITTGKFAEDREALKESRMTVPETPSHDQPCDVMCAGVWKENVNSHESGPIRECPE